jgi:hypothetical protein
MTSVNPCELPPTSLLQTYAHGGGFADCYAVDLPWRVAHADYVEAFYTTPLFKIERGILKWLVARPATDAEAHSLAAGTLDHFAAWRVEARAPDQLLLSDFRGRTRSWLMVADIEVGAGSGTRLYFGSAVTPGGSGPSVARTMGLAFRLLLGFHALYSRALLNAARSRLTDRHRHPNP